MVYLNYKITYNYNIIIVLVIIMNYPLDRQYMSDMCTPTDTHARVINHQLHPDIPLAQSVTLPHSKWLVESIFMR